MLGSILGSLYLGKLQCNYDIGCPKRDLNMMLVTTSGYSLAISRVPATLAIMSRTGSAGTVAV